MSTIGNLPFSIRENDGVMIDAAGQVVGDGIYGRGAREIARACNSHEGLVEALEQMLILGENEKVRETNHAMIKAREALKLARKE